MNQLLKNAVMVVLLCAAILLVFSVGMIWSEGWPRESVQRGILFGSGGLVALCASVLAWGSMRRDRVPDFLRHISRRFFERDGFTFSIVPTCSRGVAALTIFWQTRYENPSQAVVILGPGRQFLGDRRDLDSMQIFVDCPGSGFGIVQVPWAIPAKYQGKKQTLEVAAAVDYPNGRGRAVRFRNGLQVGVGETTAFQAAVSVGALMTGHIVLRKPAKMTITLPAGVAEQVPDGSQIRSKVLWKPGEDPAWVDSKLSQLCNDLVATKRVAFSAS